MKTPDFISDSLSAQAEMDLADQTHFVLTEAEWDAFMEALEAPAEPPEGLKRLFSHPSVAESRGVATGADNLEGDRKWL